MAKGRKLFCEYNKVFYKISVMKECMLRDVKHLLSGQRFASKKNAEELPNIVKGHRSLLLRELLGVDIIYQQNKVINLILAQKQLDGLIIRPGETFSFWKTVGRPSRKKGYIDGLVLSRAGLNHGIGGGICQMANMLHWLALHSPLQITELHHHTDCVFPDEKRRVPFGTGTSVFYKNIDYQFKNTTEQDVQFRIWLDSEYLYGELRSEEPFPHLYRLEEEGHHYAYDGDKLYRNSKVYQLAYDKKSRALFSKRLILENHSEVLFDYSLIDSKQILNVRDEVR